MNLLLHQKIKIPKAFLNSTFITDYTAAILYPRDAARLKYKEYKKALKLSTQFVEWSKQIKFYNSSI